MKSEQLIQGQFDAYNSRDLSQFISYYHPDIQLFNFPNSTPFLRGMDDFKKSYQDVFENSPQLNAELVNRIILENKIIDYEKISNRKEIDYMEAVVVYEFSDNLISKVYYIR